MPEIRPRKWKMLTNLSLNHNQLSQLPAGLFMLPKLAMLDVRYNRLQSLPLDLVRVISRAWQLSRAVRAASNCVFVAAKPQSEARQLKQLRLKGNALKHHPYSVFKDPLLQHCDASLNQIESVILARSEESRVGKEGVGTWRGGWER